MSDIKASSSTPTRRRLARLVAFGAAATLLAGCSSARVGDNTADQAGDDPLTADCAAYEPTQGVTDDEITIGASLPVTGPLAAAGSVRHGIDAYFQHINETEGGVEGRELRLVVRDDAYDPAKTSTNVNELVNNEGVFAILAMLGTANVLGAQPQLQEACVPNLLVATGAPVVATPENTWAVPALPTYTVEAQVLARLAVAKGSTSVAIIAQNDDFGRAYADGLKDELADSDVEVVDEVTYEAGAPSVTTEVTQLASSDADAVLIAALGTKCPQIINGIEKSGWDPQLLVGSLCTSRSLLDLLEGKAGEAMISTQWYKSPGDPRWSEDPALSEYREAMSTYAPDANADEDFVLNGWLWAQLFVEILKTADDLDRASVMTAARNADLHVDTMLDGIRFRTGEDDPESIEALQAVQYDRASGRFEYIDPETGRQLKGEQTKLVDVESSGE